MATSAVYTYSIPYWLRFLFTFQLISFWFIEKVARTCLAFEKKNKNSKLFNKYMS